MKLKTEFTENETNILGVFLIIFILLFANMPFYFGHVTFLGAPRWYAYMAGLYSCIFQEPFACSTLTHIEKAGHPIFVFSLKQNLFSVLLAVVTIICLCLKKYKLASIWFFFISLSGLCLFYYLIANANTWIYGIEFLSERLLLLISSCCSFIVGVKIAGILDKGQPDKQNPPS